MKRQFNFLLTIFLAYIMFAFLYSCKYLTTEKEKTNKISENYSTEIQYEKLEIPKSWTEIKKQNNEWVYIIPCHKIRELLTVDISQKDNVKAISCNFGTEEQGFVIKSIHHLADSIVFTTYLPYEDSSSTVPITMKYVDREKNIVQWITDGVICTYIPTVDTIKYKRIIEPCE